MSEDWVRIPERKWAEIGDIPSRSYTCSFCGCRVGAHEGYYSCRPYDTGGGFDFEFIYICPNCNRPTFFSCNEAQYPAPAIGQSLSSLPDEIDSLYEEARRAASANCPTAVAMCCRKILMHIAVEKGAKEDLSFARYVLYLVDNGYINQSYKEWVDHIRDAGNDANHEIILVEKEEAERVLLFTEMLLRIIYEYPAGLKGSR